MSNNGTLSAKTLAFDDVEREMAITRTVLEAVPEDKFQWKPTDKSMTLHRLAYHVAQMPEWIVHTLGMDELDFATMPRPAIPATKAELLAFFDRKVAEMRQVIASFDMARMSANWTIRQGPQVLASKPRLLCYRVWCMNHLMHHRGQLTMFLRLLNVPVPAVYFNSADKPDDWIFE